MNIETKFGLKDSFATAVILAVMLIFIVTGIASSVDARPVWLGGASRHIAGEVLKLEPIVVTASRHAHAVGGNSGL